MPTEMCTSSRSRPKSSVYRRPAGRHGEAALSTDHDDGTRGRERFVARRHRLWRETRAHHRFLSRPRHGRCVAQLVHQLTGSGSTPPLPELPHERFVSVGLPGWDRSRARLVSFAHCPLVVPGNGGGVLSVVRASDAASARPQGCTWNGISGAHGYAPGPDIAINDPLVLSFEVGPCRIEGEAMKW